MKELSTCKLVLVCCTAYHHTMALVFVNLFIIDMETIVGCPAMDQLIQSSKTLDDGETARENSHLKWIPYSEFTDIESIEHYISNQPAYYATYEKAKYIGDPESYKLVEMLLLGTVDKCAQEFIHEFAKTHSL